MKIWKLFLIIFISYPILLYVVGVILLIIGFGFFQNVPYLLTIFIKTIGFPVVMVEIILKKFISNLVSKQVIKYIAIILANFIVAAFFTVLVFGMKVIVKKL